MGYYELHINDEEKVGNHVLDPAWTDYSKRVLYSTYDVTHELSRGHNAIADPVRPRLVRENLPRRPKLICQLRGEYPDGKPFPLRLG